MCFLNFVLNKNEIPAEFKQAPAVKTLNLFSFIVVAYWWLP